MQCEELDLTEILKKKEEIAETRKDLFQEIAREKEEYVCGLTCVLHKNIFLYISTSIRFLPLFI